MKKGEAIAIAFCAGRMVEVILLDPLAYISPYGKVHRCMYLDEQGRRCTTWVQQNEVYRLKKKNWTEPLALKKGDYVTALASPANDEACEPVMKVEIVRGPLNGPNRRYCTGKNRWFHRDALRKLSPNELSALKEKRGARKAA